VNNARDFIAAVASCSYPLCPLLPPTLKSGGACAPPEYIAPAPMHDSDIRRCRRLPISLP